MKESIINEEKKEEELIISTDESKVQESKENDKEKTEKNKEIKDTIAEENNETESKKSKQKAKRLKKETEKMNSKKSKKKYILISSIIAVIIVIGAILSTIFAIFNINNDKMMSGISISGIEVSGLSKEEAKAKIETVYNEKKQEEIAVKYQDYETTINPTLLEVNYHIDKAIEEAYSVGRRENIFLNNYDILFALIAKKNINVEMTLNEEVVKQTINDINLNLPGVVIESSYAIEEDELIITKGKAGISIEVDKLIEQLKIRLSDINSNEDYIEISVANKEPEAIDIDKIHEEVYKEAKDAYYTKDPFTVYPEVEGVDFDVEAAIALLSEDKEEYVIKLTITKPKVTIDQIGSEAFPERLSTFTTRFDESDVDRSTNLRIACRKINGAVLMPGETFSYNKALGPRTVAAGYRNGKIYSGGQVVDGIGGGICQISSTLYNAVLMSNLEIVERRNHQFVTSYVEAGRDATVVYGAIDFRFKNTRKYPIRITASAVNGIATVSIYGIKEENEYTFKFSTNTISTIAPTTKYEEDSSLPAGTEKVKQKGSNGRVTQTYITKLLNGKVVSTELLSRDTYSAMAKIIIKGTKVVESTNTNTPVQPEIPTTPVTPTTPTVPTTPDIPETPSTETPKEDGGADVTPPADTVTPSDSITE